MMKIICIFILFTMFVCACSLRKEKVLNEVERIPVEVEKVTQDASSFIEKIEIIPLETNDSSIFHRSNKILYNKKMNMYAIYTSDQIVYTFSGNGKYIGNSKRKKGQGPDEYIMALDINFNPFLGGIDILNPYGIIYTYNPTFELISRRKFKSEFPINYLMAIDSVNYAFTHPSVWTEPEVSFTNLKTQQTVNVDYEGTICGGNYMGAYCFYHDDDDFYFVPKGLNYYFYQIDTNKKKLVPIMYLDFGDAEVKEDDLPGYAWGKRTISQEERTKISNGEIERMDYLNRSEYILPLSKFFNNNYVYIYMRKSMRGEYGRHFIYNRKKNERFLLKEQTPFLMYPCSGIVDNALFAMCNPDMISQVVDRKFMSLEEINKMEVLKEDDNPVIIKYFLKQ